MARADFYASLFGATYSAYMERPWLSSRVSRLVWGGDTGPYYESMKTVAALPDGATAVDCPCGAGPVLRALRPAGPRYVGVSYWGLHCFEQPGAALAEAARVLAPGGRLVGSSFVRGEESRRQRLLIRPHRGDFGPLGTQEEIESWIAAAGLELTGRSRSGPFLFFEAVPDGS